jgi:hypothetical protein
MGLAVVTGWLGVISWAGDPVSGYCPGG